MREKTEYRLIAFKGVYRRVAVVLASVVAGYPKIAVGEAPTPLKINSKTPIADEVAEMLKDDPIRFPKILM